MGAQFAIGRDRIGTSAVRTAPRKTREYSKNKLLTCQFVRRDVRKTDENPYVQKYEAACCQNHAKFNELLGPEPLLYWLVA